MQNHEHETNQSKRWSQQEKKMLLDAHREYQDDWKLISNMLPGRTSYACHSMWNILKKKQVRKIKKIERREHSNEQDQLLLQLYKQYPQNWDKISESFSKRTPQALECRYKSINKFNFTKTMRNWVKQQDQLLLLLVNILEFNWNDIKQLFTSCSAYDCYKRYKLLNDKVGKWSLEEDNKLLELFEKYDTNWQKICKQLKKNNNRRTSVSCYQRFNKLKSINLQKPWSVQQFQKLLNFYTTENANWQQISKKFPNFSPQQCYFKYYDSYKNRNIK